MGAGGSAGGAGGAGQAGGAGASGATNEIVTFSNGDFWNDTTGKHIEAHGAGFLRAGDTWYWFGEDKSGNSSNFLAVNCYASKDLVTWEFQNAVVTRSTASELAAADRIIERPKVVYNDTTKKFVMWLHFEGANYAEAAAGVLTSDTVDGDYHYESSFRPKNHMSRDDNLFKDDDGKAYFVSAANENADMILYELSADYLSIARQLVTLWPGSYREAPALFKTGGRYFLVTSAATGWDPNQARYASATSIDGPWSSLSDLGDGTTYDTQPSYVIPVVGSEATTFVYAGDRWKDPELRDSKYIWLPLVVEGSTLRLDFQETWQLDLGTGRFAAVDEFVPRTDWKLVFVDSEETNGEDGRATNAFDDSSSTIWHTEWQDAQPPPPHEVQIDLGASYALTAFRYLPRQDKDANGMVKDYAFYVSDSTSSFGTPVASGAFGSGRGATRVDFPEKIGRYVRFVAKSEQADKAYTSMAELDVVGTRQ